MTSALLVLASLLPAQGQAPEPQALEMRADASLVLKVLDRDRAVQALITAAAALEGFHVSSTSQQLVLRVPTASLPKLLATAEAAGNVVDRTLSTRSVTPELAQLRKQIASKRELLTQYFTVLEGATAKAVVTVERQISALVTQIEQLEGRSRMLEYRAALAELSVRFEFQDRTPPPQSTSSFPWLNQIGLSRLYEDFAR